MVKIPCTRLIADPALSPEENMARDEALLTLFTVSDLPILRFYDWNKTAISIGRLQKSTLAINYHPGTPFVRRPTGGGLVVHGADVTFTFIFTASFVCGSGKANESYRRIHEGVSKGLAGLGYKTSFYEEKTHPKYLTKPCFNHPVRDDLMADTLKIAGGAQKRRGKIILHQGSIQNLTNRYSPQIIRNAIRKAFEETFLIAFFETPLTEAEEILSKKLCVEKYTKKEWNFKY